MLLFTVNCSTPFIIVIATAFFPYTSAEILEEANLQFHDSGRHALFPPHKSVPAGLAYYYNELEQRPYSSGVFITDKPFNLLFDVLADRVDSIGMAFCSEVSHQKTGSAVSNQNANLQAQTHTR